MARTDGQSRVRTATRADGGKGEHWLHTLLAVAVWLAIWQVAAWAVGSDLLLAGPLETVAALVGLAGDSAFWARVGWSFVRIAGGFALAFACALLLAYLSWRHAAFETFLRPALSAIKSTPVVCIVVMLLIWFGSHWVSAVSVFLVVLPAMYFSALEGLRSLDAERLNMLRLFGVPRARQLGAYVWPQVQPFLLATSKMVVGMSWKAGVAAELIGTPVSSIGERIYQAKILLETAQVFAWTIVVVAAAYACERVFLWLLGRSAAWSVRHALDSAAGEGRPQGVNAAYRNPASQEVSADCESPVGNGTVPRAVSVRHVSKSFGGRELYANLTHDFAAGSRTCVMAPSGSGKTTLLRMVAGLEQPDAGCLSIADGTAPDAGASTAEKGLSSHGIVSMAYQSTCLLESLSAVENVVLVARLNSTNAHSLLAEVLPEDVLDKPVSELSGGERRRVELVRALAAPSSVVLLDEPFSSLDEETHAICTRFVLIHQAGRTLLVATHDATDATLLDADILRLQS